MPKFLWLLFAIVAVWVKGISAKELQILTVNEAPANYLDNQGQLTGYVTDIVRALQTQLNDTTPIQLVPEARAIYTGYKHPNIIMFSFSRIAKREKDFYWVMPVMKKTWSIIYLSQSDIHPTSLNSLKALSGIGVVRGDVRQLWLKQKGFLNLQPVTSHEQNLKRLIAGRVPAIAYENSALIQISQNLNINAKSFKSFPFYESVLYLIMSKPNTDTGILYRWKLAAEQLKASGQLEAISQKWKRFLEQEFSVSSKIEDDILVL